MSNIPHDRPAGNLDTIPAALQVMSGWVVSGADKIPYNPVTLRRANPTNPATGGTFAEALAAVCRHRRFDRLGLILPGDPLAFDWDDCVDPETGAIDPAILAEVIALGCYVEYSPSRTGLRGFAFGTLPPGGRKRGPREVYERDRYVSITGWHVAGPTEIPTVETDALRRWHAAHFASPAAPSRPNPHLADLVDVPDEEVLRRAERTTGFHALFAGDLSVYGGDHSAGDLGLLNYFVGAGAADPDQLDRLFRQSSLYRQKWERRDYRERTIARSLDGRVAPWAGWRQDNNPSAIAVTPPDPQTLPISADPCAERIAALERELAAARATIATQAATIDALREVISSSTRILGNKSLGPQRVIAATLATQFAWRATATERPPSEVDTPPPHGMMRVSVAELARLAGVSPNSAGNHLQMLAEQGVIQRKVERRLDHVNRATGELYDEPQWTSAHFVGPSQVRALTPTAAAAFARQIADFTIERIERRGGKRTPRCPDHPNADVIREYVDRCAECRRELASGETNLAKTTSDPSATGSSPNFANHTDPVDTVFLSANFGDHAPGSARVSGDERTVRCAAARADLAARARASATLPGVEREPLRQATGLPGFDAPPIDRWSA